MTDITPKTLVRHELIGLRVRVAESKDPTLFNREGVIIDETKKTFVLEEGERHITVIKDQTRFEFTLGGKVVEVDGKILVERPEDRIKKRFRS